MFSLSIANDNFSLSQSSEEWSLLLHFESNFQRLSKRSIYKCRDTLAFSVVYDAVEVILKLGSQKHIRNKEVDNHIYRKE